jgi:hypothetical protein
MSRQVGAAIVSSTGELIAAGNLVRPRTFVIDVGFQSALAKVKRKADDFDMTAVGAIMNRTPITKHLDSIVDVAGYAAVLRELVR